MPSSLITPNSTIYVLGDVPLDNSFDHTIYFDNPSDQANYFYGKRVFTLDEYSYQRVEKGIRCELRTEHLYSCNYLMFKNTNFGDKWFYAFITDVRYINNSVSEINFEIDVLQTWHFDYTLDYCFVARNHVDVDEIGNNIEAEPVNVGEYVANGWECLTNFGAAEGNDDVIIIAVSEVVQGNPDPTPEEDDESDEESPELPPAPTPEQSANEEINGDTPRDPDIPVFVDGKIYDGIYGGLTLYAFPMTPLGVTVINAFLSTYIEKPDSICSIYTVPNIFPFDVGTLEHHKLPQKQAGDSYGIVCESDALTGEELLDGYKPHNRKLYTFPYNFYHVDNASGGGLDIRYEFISTSPTHPYKKPRFIVNSTVTQPVKCLLRPHYYKTTGNDIYETFSESLELNGFPQCSWNLDAYYAWVAQNSVPEGMKLGAGLVNMVGSFFSGLSSLFTRRSNQKTIQQAYNDVRKPENRMYYDLEYDYNPLKNSTAQSGISTAVSSLSNQYGASIAADFCRGSISSGNVNYATGRMNFYGARFSISHQTARVIDSFFDRFGYAINLTKVPLRVARKYWTYVQTAGCTITGSISFDDMKQICSIYDKGITWWKYQNNIDTIIGNYGLVNTPNSELNN